MQTKNKSSINKFNSKSNIKLIVLACIISSLNVIFLKSFSASLIIVVLESLILGYYFLKGDITNYLGCYLVFLTLSFEYEYIVGGAAFYGFKNFRILGLNLGIIFLLPIVIKLVFKKINVSKFTLKHPNLFLYVQLILIMSTTGVFIGLINFLTNDNNILSMNNSVVLFVGNVYQGALFPLLIILSFMYIVLFEENKIIVLVDYISAILIGSVFAMVISLVTNNMGYYGGVVTLLSPMVNAFITFLILFLLFRGRIKSSGIIFLAYLIGLYLLFIYNASGKLFLLTLFSLATTIPILVKQKKIKATVVLIMMLPVVGIGVFLLFNTLMKDNLLFTIKLDQAIKMLNLFDPNWFNNMPSSPKIRISEFINIIIEYAEKPWYLLFGKGYLGTVRDHIETFNGSLGAFSDSQWVNGSFYAMHTSLNTLFLTHGLFGLVVLFSVVKLAWKKLIYSPLGTIGSIWFLVYYGYSITLSSFGLICLLIALYEIDNKGNILDN
ncbi:hypothetical protein [Neobacillus vireti]|uniref:Flagellar biosynthesis n=1 Tax=Neobacillus vireti LMG 21834 TaxID=1131730 RepID=A0AB94IQ46_9BACI|nr:hypothetical protein [Neobacillus vireti]ETI69195.1 flagellar biosynthesis [Neobacillus vireti LMG 21834]KLT15568.1 hypothetical protein AA980_23290 [Neobacillus vireti]